MRIREVTGDYRENATRGVALAATMLLLPFTVYALITGLYVVACGGLYITAVLVINTQLAARGYNHEPMTQYGLVPGGIFFMALAYRVDGDMASIWCFPSVLACYCMLGRHKAVIANVMILVVAVPMMWLTLETLVFARVTASLIAVSIFANILVREIDAQQHRLQYQLEHDPLTGLLSRTSLKTRLEKAIEAFHKNATPAALLTIDLDHFKTVNDRFGHDSGDRVLCEVARLLKLEITDDDAAFRLGGEEFLILLTGDGDRVIRRRAELLRRTIGTKEILNEHPVTASIGIAKLRVSDDRESWTKRSDNRLYSAKHGGRNRVVFAGETDLDHVPVSHTQTVVVD